MSRTDPPSRGGQPAVDSEWLRHDAERNARARRDRLRIDARKGIGQNLEEGAALIALGFEMLSGFEHNRG